MACSRIKSFEDYLELILYKIKIGDHSKIAKLEASGIDKLFDMSFRKNFSKLHEAARYYISIDNIPSKFDVSERMMTIDVVLSPFRPPPIQFCVVWDINGYLGGKLISKLNESKVLRLVFTDEEETKEVFDNILRVKISNDMYKEIDGYAKKNEIMNIRMEIPRYFASYKFVDMLAKKYKIEICLGDLTVTDIYLNNTVTDFDYFPIKQKDLLCEEGFGSFRICQMKNKMSKAKDLNKRNKFLCCFNQNCEEWSHLHGDSFIVGPGKDLFMSIPKA